MTHVYNLLICVLFAAVFLAACRDGSDLAYQLFLYLTYAILVGSIVGVILSHKNKRLMIFCVIGWSYFLPIFVFCEKNTLASLPTQIVFNYIMSRTRPSQSPPLAIQSTNRSNRSNRPATTDYMNIGTSIYLNDWKKNNLVRICHLCIPLICVYLGRGSRRHANSPQNNSSQPINPPLGPEIAKRDAGPDGL